MTISFNVKNLPSLVIYFLLVPVELVRLLFSNKTQVRKEGQLLWCWGHVHVLLLTIALLHSTPTYAVYVNSDGMFSFSEADVMPLIDSAKEQLPYDGFKDRPGIMIVKIVSERNSYSYPCVFEVQGPEMSLEELLGEGRTVFKEILYNYTNKLLNGGYHCPKNANGYRYSIIVQIASTTKYQNVHKVISGRTADIPPGPPPAECSAYVTGPMAFGIVTRRKPRSQTAETSIRVSCSNDSVIAIKVNDGSPFLDPESGTQISFDTHNDTLNNEKVCKEDCSVRVIGEMISTPDSPGAYTWAAPVIVEYK